MPTRKDATPDANGTDRRAPGRRELSAVAIGFGVSIGARNRFPPSAFAGGLSNWRPRQVIGPAKRFDREVVAGKDVIVID